MPVGLEETFDGVKVAPDVTYKHTFQYPEHNNKVVSIYLPVNKQSCQHGSTTIKFARPNLDIIPRPDTRHLYDETRSSIKNFVARGLVRSRLRPLEANEYFGPTAYLQRVPPTTPQHCNKRRAGSRYSSYSSKTGAASVGVVGNTVGINSPRKSTNYVVA